MAKPKVKTHEQAAQEKTEKLHAAQCPTHIMRMAQARGLSWDQLLTLFDWVKTNLPEIVGDVQAVWAKIEEIINIVKPAA